MVPEHGSEKDPSVAGPLGSLALAQVKFHASTLGLRVLGWHASLQRLGVTIPLYIVSDLGLLLSVDSAMLAREPRSALGRGSAGDDERNEMLRAYRSMLDEIAASEVARQAKSLRLEDDLIVVLLARLLGSVAARCPAPPYLSAVPLDVDLLQRTEPRLQLLFEAVNRSADWAALRQLLTARLYVLTLIDALDTDTLRLFGMLGGDSDYGALAQVDLLNALGAPEANDVVGFALEILPSVLETKRRAAAGHFSVEGYAGLSRKGSIDSMVLTELVWDEPELMRRLADNEVFYFSREQSRSEARRTHHLLIDASASMRGQRATFARGMALATAKKLTLAGEEVVFRFFDSRLYEPHQARIGKLPIAHVLSFKGERGRNPARVFGELATLLESDGRRAAQAVVHVFTHGALYIPRDVVLSVTRSANVAVIFMLPSGGQLSLDYLEQLDSYWIVDHTVIANKTRRVAEAKRILSRVSVPADSGALSSRSRSAMGHPEEEA